MKRGFSISAILAFLFLGTAVIAGEISFYGETDKNPLSYQPGEEMVFSIQLLDDGVPSAGKTVRWTRTGDDGKTETGEAVSEAVEPLVLRTSLDVPGFVRIQVSALDESGNPIPGEQHEFNGGAGVEIDKLASFAEPEDFDAFWARQKERLAAVPMNPKLTEVESGAEGVKCYDLRVDSVGAPVSGYFCLPEKAAEKSLPATLVLQGYGVASASKEVNTGKEGLALCINAHGIENGREPEFYTNLFNTDLKSYGLPADSNTDPETSYWNGVAMRVMRALEFLKSRPEWDGKTIQVTGGSQGGFQSILAASLDPDVTACTLYVPWFCDVSGTAEQGRNPSLFRPEWVPALGYYDGVNHAKRIKCPVKIIAGLGDYICPPSGVTTFYNNLSCPAKLEFYQGRTHGYSMKDAPVYYLEKNRYAKNAKNVILMIGDGMGFNSDVAGTYWRYGEADKQTYHQFPIALACTTFSIKDPGYTPQKVEGFSPDRFWNNGMSGAKKGTDFTQTTDSAASATAINTGQKTQNGRIGTDFFANPLTSYGQIAAAAGRSVGIVSTSSIPDATLAAVMAHAVNRGDSYEIVCEMLLEQPTAVIFGGGHPEYSKGFKIEDKGQRRYNNVGGKHVWRALQKNDGFAEALFIDDRSEFEKLAEAVPGSGSPLPGRVFGVIKSGELPAIDGYDDAEGKAHFESAYGDVNTEVLPTLAMMSTAALNVLAQNENGFYVMIEGAKIDSGNHGRNIEKMVLEHEGFSKAIDAVCDWVEKYSSWDETLLVITADHETGQLWGARTYTDANENGQFDDGDEFQNFMPIVNNGKGKLPSVQYGGGGHTNSLVPFWAKGAGSELAEIYVRGRDRRAGDFWHFSGKYIDNTDITPFFLNASGLQ